MILSFFQLAMEVIQNMATIKQLSIENEVLRQYSQFTDKIFMLVSRIVHNIYILI